LTWFIRKYSIHIANERIYLMAS